MTTRLGRIRPATAGPAVPPAPDPRDREAGMVTAEFAVALPAFVVTTLAAVGLLVVVLAQLRCSDAAAIAARLAARGEQAAAVRAIALQAAPGGATLTTSAVDGVVTGTVAATVSIPGLGRLVPGITVRASVSDPAEPASAGAAP